MTATDQVSEAALDLSRQVEMYRHMVRIREFEERVKRTFAEHPGVIRGHTHLADGAEASIVGSLTAIRPGDQVMATYRCHGYPIALGTDTSAMMAEIYGRATGLCKGYGGSMHLVDLDRGFLGTSGIVGQSIPQGTGAAYAAQLRGRGEVVLTFFGDGASKQGAFHESLNLAALWKLPVVYVMENNSFSVEVRTEEEDANAAAGEPLATKAKAYSIPGVTIDGSDPLVVHEAVATAVARARSGAGPTLIESKVYRLSAHGNSIAPPGVPLHFPEHEAIARYGDVAEYEAAKRGDPVPKFRAHLVEQGLLSVAEGDAILDDARAEMQRAVDFALNSPFPEPSAALSYGYA
ncbi:thiamine pyrophosphate-dependent dehydrogenase E1 component subunit alpha [Amycolatopsis japonica]